MIRPENRNLLWASILVDELARTGVRQAVIAPGSRSTPLAVAFSRDDRFTVHSVLDERAAAFFGLGIGKASGVPAAVVCTSGTAAANFFPAVVEASMAGVPLIVLTADRPHELRDSGANQTIDQVRLYGGYPRWFVDIAPPHANPELKTIRYLRTTVDRAVAAARGENPGPVHLNVPFEKPLEPVHIEGDVPDALWEAVQAAQGDAPQTAIERSAAADHSGEVVLKLLERITRSPRGLIVAGPDSTVRVDVLSALSRATGYPVLAEGLSHGRLYGGAQRNEGLILGGYETFLRGELAEALRPDLIIQTGSLPVSAALLDYLARQTQAQRVLISDSGRWADEALMLDEFVHADPVRVLSNTEYHLALTEEWHNRLHPDPAWAQAFEQAEAFTWAAVDELLAAELVEGAVLADVVDLLPDRSGLFIANSNPVRHLDQFVRPQDRQLSLLSNRGASGIDGTLASALGMATHCDHPVLVAGDLALYHDLNSLHLVSHLNLPLVIVCINNDGGGIFHRLPIADYDPPFRDLFVTPHGLSFKGAEAMFGVPYMRAAIGGEFREAFRTAVELGGPALIEVPSDAALFEAQRRRLNQAVAERIRDAKILQNYQSAQSA